MNFRKSKKIIYMEIWIYVHKCAIFNIIFLYKFRENVIDIFRVHL